MAVRFDAGTDRYLDTAAGGHPTGTTAKTWTVCLWAKIITDQNDYSALLEFSANNDTDGIWLMTGPDGTTLGIFTASYELDASSGLTTGTWYRIAAVQSSSSITLYWGAAGAALSSVSGTITGANFTIAETWLGGEEFDAWLNGSLAAVKVYNAALTVAEIENELAQYVPHRAQDVLRWHDFLGPDTVDRSGNARTLTAGSTATSLDPDGPPIPWGPQRPRLIVPSGVPPFELGRPAEADIARALSAAKARALAGTSSSDTARALTAAKAITLGRAAESDGAAALTERRGLGATGESDTARTLGAAKVFTLGRAGGTAAARALTATKTVALGRPAETDTPRAVTTSKVKALGVATEADGARSTAFSLLHPISRASETSAARAIGHSLSWQLGRAGTVEALRPWAAGKTIGLDKATELQDHARPITITRSYPLGRAHDTSRARSLRALSAATRALNISLWAVDRDNDDRLVPLPHFTKLTFGPVANAPGGISVDYPAYGRNAELIDRYVTGESDLEVEIWLGGRREGALRGYLTQRSGDDVDERAIRSCTGSLMEYRLEKTLVYPQPADEKKEFRVVTATPGEVAIALHTQAQARGALTDISIDFTDTHDSDGVAWPDVLSGKWSPGKTTYLQLLQKLVELGLCEFEITAEKVWRMWVFGGRGADRTSGTDRVRLRRGVNLTEASRRVSSREGGTVVLVDGSEGLYSEHANLDALAARGRRDEVSLSAGNIEDQGALDAFADKAAQAVGDGTDERTFGLTLGDGQPKPGLGFGVGDTVSVVTDNRFATTRLAQYQYDVDSSGVKASVVGGNLIADRLAAMFRRLADAENGSITVGTSTSSAEDTLAPAAPTGLAADSVAYQEANSPDTYARVDLSWSAVTTNSDGSAAGDVAGYRVRYALLNIDEVGPAFAPEATLTWYEVTPVDGTTGLTWSWGGVAAGAGIRIQVRAFDRSGNASAWSTGLDITTEADITPPPIPSAPGLAVWFRTIDESWDGLDEDGADMFAAAPDTDHVELWLCQAGSFSVPTEASTATAFDPDSTDPQHVANLYTAGTWNQPGVPHGVGWYGALRAVDRTGNPSGLSEIVGPVTAEQLVTDDLIDDIIDANKLGPNSVESLHVVNGAIGSAKIVDAAIIRAKIADLAVNSAKVEELQAGLITTGTLVSTVTLTGIIRTASSGLRWEGDNAGIRFYNSGGTKTIDLQGASGNVLVTGTYQSGLSGERINLLTDGTMRFYGATGTDYAQIANDGGVLRFTSRLGSSSRRSFVDFDPTGLIITYGVPGGTVRSGLSCGLTYAVLRGPVTGVRVMAGLSPDDGTENRFHFVTSTNADQSGDLGNSVIHYQARDSDDLGGLVGPGRSGLLWANGALGVIGGTIDSGNAAIVASAFNPPSSAVVKTTPVVPAFGPNRELTPLDVIDAAPAMEWAYLFEADRPRHFGPIAEDLAAVDPCLVFPHYDGKGLVVDLRDLLGVAWAAIAQLRAQLAELRDRVDGPGPVVIDGDAA